MATHLREAVSIETVADTCDAIASALGSDPEAAELAGTWEALAERGDALVAAERAHDRAVRRARARLNVADARWDRESAAFGRAVVDANGGRREGAPYSRFFAKVVPSKARALGAAREVEIGRHWLAELARTPGEPLAAAFAPRLEASTEALADAIEARAASMSQLAIHRTSVSLFIDDVNREIDRTEGELLVRFPGDRARVAAFLEITRIESRRPDRAAATASAAAPDA